VTHRQEVIALFLTGESQIGAIRTSLDGKVKRRGDQDCNDRDEEQGGVELGCGRLDRLFGVSDSTGEEAPGSKVS
jgi:hypothetical protein